MELNISNVNTNEAGTYHCIAKNEHDTTKGIITVIGKLSNIRHSTFDIPIPVRGVFVDSHKTLIQHFLEYRQGLYQTAKGKVFGKDVPERVDIDDLCPAQIPCQECPDPKEFKCKTGFYSYELLGGEKLKAIPLESNHTYPGLPNRTLGECTTVPNV